VQRGEDLQGLLEDDGYGGEGDGSGAGCAARRRFVRCVGR